MIKNHSRVVVKIKNSRSQFNASDQGRIIRFTHVDFNRNGDSFIAADCHGHVYYFNLAKNRLLLQICYICIYIVLYITHILHIYV